MIGSREIGNSVPHSTHLQATGADRQARQSRRSGARQPGGSRLPSEPAYDILRDERRGRRRESIRDKRGPMKSGRRRIFIAIAALCLAAAGGEARLQVQAQNAGRPSSLPGLISKAKLDPALIGRLSEMQFSPNGASLLLQDESAAYVIGLNPVRMQLTVGANNILPMRFSGDSQELVAATRNMQVARFKVATGSRIDQKTLGDGGRCYAAALSNDGEFYACLDDKSELRIFRASTGQQIFSKTIGEQEGPAFPLPAPYHQSLARSEPFGYFLTTDFLPPVATTAAMLNFSTDGRYLIARSKFFQQPAQLIDLQSKKTIDMPKALRGAADTGTVTFVAADRVVATTLGPKSESELLSFPRGEVVGKLDVTGLLRATNDPRYIIDVPFDMSGPQLVDLQTGKPAARLSMGGNDVKDNMIASYGGDGVLTLRRIGEPQPALRVRTPLSALPILKTAAVSPGLQEIAVGIDGSAGIYSVQAGKQIAAFPALAGAWFPDDQMCYVRTPGIGPVPDTLERVEINSGATVKTATVQEVPYQNETTASGTVLLTHWIKPLPPGQMPAMGGRSFPYEIHALDLANGKELWRRAFDIDPYSQTPQIKSTPVVYTDPQGDRIVLGWGARTEGGKHAAEQYPNARQLMKQVKVTEHDSVFEVLDARSGKTIGAMFVQTSGGADTFDSVFSEGDWLVLVKDGRIEAISLSTGAQAVQDTGTLPAISPEAGLLSYAGDSGQVTVTNLNSPAQKRQFTFPSDAAYSHFSADGKRLLVMTEDQSVYVLDVSGQATPATQP
jgi:outer membrane protein assembly factor BamB